MADPLAAIKSRECGEEKSAGVAGKTHSSAPESTKNFFPDRRSLTDMMPARPTAAISGQQRVSQSADLHHDVRWSPAHQTPGPRHHGQELGRFLSWGFTEGGQKGGLHHRISVLARCSDGVLDIHQDFMRQGLKSMAILGNIGSNLRIPSLKIRLRLSKPKFRRRGPEVRQPDRQRIDLRGVPLWLWHCRGMDRLCLSQCRPGLLQLGLEVLSHLLELATLVFQHSLKFDGVHCQTKQKEISKQDLKVIGRLGSPM